MDAFLNTTFQIQAYADRPANSNPRLRAVDWRRDLAGQAVSNPKSESVQLVAGETRTLFNGTRSTTLDGTTAFTMSLSTLESGRYRFTKVAGTDPSLRTSRGLTLNTVAVTAVALANGSLTMTVPGPAAFTGVVAGDIVFVPNTNTGDAVSPFSISNSGYWAVMAVLSPQSLSLARLPSASFEGVSEVVTLTSNAQLRAYSAAGMQVGDSVAISAGFSTATQKTYDVVAVTDTFFEVRSSLPLPLESSVIPTAVGMVFYSSAKNFLYVEGDQEFVIRLNGSTDSTQRVSPVSAGEIPGAYFKNGPTWSLAVVNMSSTLLNLMVIGAE